MTDIEDGCEGRYLARRGGCEGLQGWARAWEVCV